MGAGQTLAHKFQLLCHELKRCVVHDPLAEDRDREAVHLALGEHLVLRQEEERMCLGPHQHRNVLVQQLQPENLA